MEDSQRIGGKKNNRVQNNNWNYQQNKRNQTFRNPSNNNQKCKNNDINSGKNQADLLCYVCGQPGHKSFTCPLVPQRLQIQQIEQLQTAQDGRYKSNDSNVPQTQQQVYALTNNTSALNLVVEGYRISRELLDSNKQPNEEGLIMLMKDRKLISRVKCIYSPIKVPSLRVFDYKASTSFDVSGLPHFLLCPAFDDDHQRKEWGLFTKFLMENNKVALALDETYVFYIFPPDMGTAFINAIVFYQMKEENKGNKSADTIIRTSNASMNKPSGSLRVVATPHVMKSEVTDENLDACSRERDSRKQSPGHIRAQSSRHHYDGESTEGVSRNSNEFVAKNYVGAHSSYLRTLGQTHSGWMFGAIAELVDNSRDAKATKLDILVKSLKKNGKEIVMLSVIDDGQGMSPQEILRMLSFGCKEPDADDPSRIGRFGIGFKTGSMRIGRDAIVLTQTTKSRSIGFLSQSLNEGKNMLEIPIVSYCKEGPLMEFDTSVHTKATAENNLRVIKAFSVFDEYFIGALFSSYGTGTQIYIWNLDEWGLNYCLEWKDGSDTSPEGDIYIRSRRVRRRPGQISQKVPLDYSLRSYLEVIFLDPRMKIYVQGSMVKSRPLAKFLNKTTTIQGHIMGKSIQLTLGRSQLEWEHMNCGIFLYWHGRLIEAYKRVGGMVHNTDMGRGIIGVIDVTDLMNDGKHVLVHNDKQGFQDSEVYAQLEDWLGNETDKYWDTNFDKIQVIKSNTDYQPDQEWVQCDKCRKWRILSPCYESRNLPVEWFCYMPPFSGKCETPEQQIDRGVITVGTKWIGCDSKQKHVQGDGVIEKNNVHELDDYEDCSIKIEKEDVCQPLKRLRRGPCTKA